MKKCPTCGKTFDDNMRFCQIDGTALMDDAPPAPEEPFDPYATIVGVPKSAIPPSTPPEAPLEPLGEPLDISPSGTVSLEPAAPAASDAGPSSSADAGPVAGETASSIPVAQPDDILDLRGDPLKTMYVSDAEMKEVLGTTSQGAETPSEEIRADESQTEAAAPSGGTDFGSISPPPSPFSAPPAPEDAPVPAPPTFLDTPATSYSEAETQVQPEPSFQDAPTMYQSEPQTPQFSEPAPAPMQQQEWNPPPAPSPEWQNQQIGSNTPFQPPPAGAGGQNKTLAIISLVLGILSVCCYISPLTGIAALITGFLALKNIKADPNTYGGRGLAIAGMITGGVFMAFSIIYWIVIVLFYGGMIASGGFR